jgi:hypothetical protein
MRPPSGHLGDILVENSLPAWTKTNRMSLAIIADVFCTEFYPKRSLYSAIGQLPLRCERELRYQQQTASSSLQSAP